MELGRRWSAFLAHRYGRGNRNRKSNSFGSLSERRPASYEAGEETIQVAVRADDFSNDDIGAWRRNTSSAPNLAPTKTEGNGGGAAKRAEADG